MTTTDYTNVETALAEDLSSRTGDKSLHVKVETFRDPKSREGQPWGFRITLDDGEPWEYHRRFILQAHAMRTARRAIRNYAAHGQFIGRPQ